MLHSNNSWCFGLYVKLDSKNTTTTIKQQIFIFNTWSNANSNYSFKYVFVINCFWSSFFWDLIWWTKYSSFWPCTFFSKNNFLSNVLAWTYFQQNWINYIFCQVFLCKFVKFLLCSVITSKQLSWGKTLRITPVFIKGFDPCSQLWTNVCFL